MSWSVSFIGSPDKVVQALEEHSASLSGQSKVEYDDARPHLVALVNQNFAKPESGYTQPLVKFSASGSGSARGEEQVQRQCTVQIEQLWHKVLI